MFEDLVLLKGEGWPFDPRTETVGADAIARMRREHPRLPDDYLAYLASVGWGSLANGGYMIYGGPITPEYVYGRLPAGLEDVLLVGDDFGGHCAGIRLADGAIVEADPGAREVWVVAPGFEAFVRARIAEFIGYRDEGDELE